MVIRSGLDLLDQARMLFDRAKAVRGDCWRVGSQKREEPFTVRLGWPERSTWAVGGNGRSENLGMTFVRAAYAPDPKYH